MKKSYGFFVLLFVAVISLTICGCTQDNYQFGAFAGSDEAGETALDNIVAFDNVKAVSVSKGIGLSGGTFSCAVKTDRSVWCWGNNILGTLGDGTKDDAPTPRQVVGPNNQYTLMNAATVACGGQHACASLQDGAVYCWGDNIFGELGMGENPSSTYPVRVLESDGTPLTDAASVVSGSSASCALKNDGTVWCWGQLGGYLASPPNNIAWHPIQIVQDAANTPLSDVTQVAAGSTAYCAVKQNGSLWCWGSSHDGVLFQGLSEQPYAQRIPSPVSAVSSVSLASENICVVEQGGASAWCWGNWESIGITPTPTKVPGVDNEGLLSGVKQFSFGSASQCAIIDHDSKRTAVCYGQQCNGLLGNGVNSRVMLSYPVFVKGVDGSGNLEDVFLIASGAHTCAAVGTANSNKLFCWGSNGHDQLGTNVATPAISDETCMGPSSSVPVPVAPTP